MRIRIALAFALLVLPAAAEDIKAKVDEFIAQTTGEQNWEKKQKLLVALCHAPGAAKAFVEAAAARADLDQNGWSLSSAAQPLLELRRDELVAPLKALLKDSDPSRAKFAVTLVRDAGLVPALAEDLLAASRRPGEAGSGGTAGMTLCQSRDPRVIDLLWKEAGQKGDRGLEGIRMLASTGAPAAKVRLREVVADGKQSEDRRAEALMGLNHDPAEEDVKLALSLLDPALDRLIESALNLLVEARAVVPVEKLKALRKPGDDWRGAFVDKLLSVAGDAEGGKACLARAHGGSDWDKAEWYAWAGRSGLKAVKEALDKAFGEETNDDVRMGVMLGIGECGDAGSVDLIAKYVTHPERSNAAMNALAALGRRNPEALDAILDKLAETTGVIMSAGVDSFYYACNVRSTAAWRATLVDAYLRFLGRINDRPRLRQATISVLCEMVRPDFEQSDDALESWKSWWKENRAEFEKCPPKVR